MESETTGRAWIISGASRGVGRALTELAAASGDLVVAGARQPENVPALDNVVPARLDVTATDDCDDAVRICLKEFGRVDAVASVVGVGLVGAIEETPPAQARAIVDVNFWGTVNLTAAALPHLRAQRSGHVIVVSSLSGRVAAAGNAFYAASKFAVEGFAESLAAELAEHGGRVTILEPGGIRTDWAGDSLQHAPDSGNYAATAGRTRDILARAHGNQGLSAGEVAEAIFSAVHNPTGALRAVVGNDARARISGALEAALSELSDS